MGILRFLTKEELEGRYWSTLKEKYKLNIFDKEQGTKAAATDLASLMGVRNTSYGNYLDEDGEEIEYVSYYTAELDGLCEMNYIVTGCGDTMLHRFDDKSIGSRPVITYSLIKEHCIEEILDDGRIMVDFGEYPQMVVKNIEQYALDKKLANNELTKTEQSFTLNGEKYFVYECNGRKFIQYTCTTKVDSILSNYEAIKENKPYWVEVSPITWIVDKEKDVAVSNYVLFGGMEFTKNERYFFDEFEDSIVGKYLNNEFLDEITPYANLLRIKYEKLQVQKELEKINQKQEENSEEFVRRMFKENGITL